MPKLPDSSSDPAAAPLDRLQARLHEACDALWDSFVDPADALFDVDGSRWMPLSSGGCEPDPSAPLDEAGLRDLRNQCRLLAWTNEFAINGHENRINYIVGDGHSYRVSIKAGLEVPAEWGALGQAELDRFQRLNDWQRRQQEIVRRRDRDGEVFLRFFLSPSGDTRVRFVEPGQVATPAERAADPAARLGILTDRDDVEQPLAYFIDGVAVDADEIQHRKANVDASVRRGLPLYYPVRKNLRRAEKLLRNMSVVAEIQSAIALVRRHRHGVRGGLQQFVAGAAETTATHPITGRTQSFQRYPAGTILDAHADVDYEFPAAGLDAASFVQVLQAELRAIASRLVMPEFMLTSDASNANYSSTMIAEGPAMRMFARLQAEQAADDLQVMHRVLANSAAAGRLPLEALSVLDVRAVPPSLAVRDKLADARRYRIEHRHGILSAQTWSQLAGLDYDREQQNRALHARSASPGGGEKSAGSPSTRAAAVQKPALTK